MLKAALFGLVIAGLGGVQAQQSAWGQCGGIGWTGQTSCVSGFYCVYSNDWYSQCVPGSPSTTSTAAPSSTRTTSSTRPPSSTSRSSMRSSSRTSSASTSRASSSSTRSSTTSSSSRPVSSSSTRASSTVSGACTAAFTPVSASVAFAGLQPGWNIGNTLDAVPDEGSWNNAPVTTTTMDDMKTAGFKSLRIPVTWHYHFLTASPTWTVNTTWMDRVETVVDQALARGFYAILNVHHDSWIWADVTASGANITMIEEKFAALWTQIATRFKCKSSKLIFEAINEPVGSTQEHATELNKLNDIFLTAVNNAGGYNPQRVVSLSGLGMDSIKTSQWFSRGSLYPNQPWGLQFHYYSPYDFIFGAWGKTIWGSDADKLAMDTDVSLFHGNFSGIPAFVGEWDASETFTEPAARWKYFDYFIRSLNRYGYSNVIWDNGIDQYDRTARKWRDPAALDILMKASAGVVNSLADSTTDGSATTQTSSAYIFHKVGAAVTAQTATYILNGRTIASIKTSSGSTLATSSYTVSGSTLTLTQAYLSTLLSATATPGIKETLTVSFSAGAALTKVQTADLYIPITWKGLAKPAAVKAVKADGTYLADDWTVYLGPLQNARWTYGNWGWDSSNFIIWASGLSTIAATGQTVTLTLEFYPRILGENSVNITITQ